MVLPKKLTRSSRLREINSINNKKYKLQNGYSVYQEFCNKVDIRQLGTMDFIFLIDHC